LVSQFHNGLSQGFLLGAARALNPLLSIERLGFDL
jgi:hypothetical protein